MLSSAGAVLAVLLLVAVVYVVVRKMYLHWHPQVLKPMSTKSGSFTRALAELTPKSTLTLFEIATGAELQHKFGVMSDYDNFVFVKGLKFASADGIYCNGFAIANGQFLVANEDILVIFLMMLTRMRLQNVYAYKVDGSKLKQTAQLVYPDTLTWTDLFNLNASILS